MTVQYHKSQWKGLDSLTCENDTLSLVIVPALGAKIASLFDKRTAHEWMWQNPASSLKSPDQTSSYIDYLGGLDECFPTIAESQNPLAKSKQTHPDHGELWNKPWRLELSEHDAGLKIIASAKSTSYEFERTVTLARNAAKLVFDYKLTSTTSCDSAYIWSSHPTFAIEHGDKITLPSRAATIYGSSKDRLGKPGTTFTWPDIKDQTSNPYNLSTIDINQRFSLKAFLPNESHIATTLENVATNSALTITLPNSVSHLGIWLNYNTWGVQGNPACCIALEPCIGDDDSLENAFKNGTSALLPPNSIHEWSFDLSIDAPAHDN